MGFLQNFFIGLIVFSLFITGFVYFQTDVFTHASPEINVTFLDGNTIADYNNTMGTYSALGDLSSTMKTTHEDTFLTENSSSEDVEFDDISMIQSTRNVFEIVLSAPLSVHNIITSIAEKLRIPDFFVIGVYTIILSMLFFAIGGLLFRKKI